MKMFISTSRVAPLSCPISCRYISARVCRWIRICRPGSIIGPQQHFLVQMQDMMWKDGDKLRQMQTLKSSTDSLVDGLASLELGPSNVGTWIEAVDSATGRKYYYNSFTKKTRWENPDKTVGGVTGAAAAAAMSHHTGAYCTPKQCFVHVSHHLHYQRTLLSACLRTYPCMYQRSSKISRRETACCQQNVLHLPAQPSGRRLEQVPHGPRYNLSVSPRRGSRTQSIDIHASCFNTG